MTATALIHSIVGEQRLISPILTLETPLTKQTLAGQVLRFAWHLTSVLMVLCAMIVVWPAVPVGLIRLTGLIWFLVGIADAILTRGKHLGWPFLAAAGVFSLVGTWP